MEEARIVEEMCQVAEEEERAAEEARKAEEALKAAEPELGSGLCGCYRLWRRR